MHLFMSIYTSIYIYIYKYRHMYSGDLLWFTSDIVIIYIYIHIHLLAIWWNIVFRVSYGISPIYHPWIEKGIQQPICLIFHGNKLEYPRIKWFLCFFHVNGIKTGDSMQIYCNQFNGICRISRTWYDFGVSELMEYP